MSHHHMKKFEHLKIELEALKLATNNFSSETSIGNGGFGSVYKGKLAHSQGQKMVAMKRLMINNIFGQSEVEFWNEITILSAYQHENIVSLLGYCFESGESILVYEYEAKGSLDRYLNSDTLTWAQRLWISIGVARGLVYLHSEDGPQHRVLHCDIKSSNILLDENWNSKIADFGLAKIGNQQMSVVVTQALGTHGYLDPVFFNTGFLTKESDIYSFGVVLFEILCGRLCTDKPYLINVVKRSYEQNRIEELIFGNIKDRINPTSFGLFNTIAFQCLKEDPEERPLAIHIVRALEAALRCQMNNINFSEQPVGELNVKIIKAIDLKRVFRVFSPSTYVNLRLTKDEEDVTSKKTKVVDQDVNPEWNEEFILLVKNLDVQALEIVVSQDQRDENEQWINVVPLKRFRPEERETFSLDLFKNMQNSKSYGKIMVAITYKPFGGLVRKVNEGGGLLVVTIHEGQHLDKKNAVVYLQMDDSSSHEFIKQTMHANSSKNPVWKEKFEFTFDKPPTDRILTLSVYGSSTWLQSFTGWYDFTGSKNYVEISLAEIVNKKHTNKFYKLEYSKKSNAGLQVEMEWRSLATRPQ